MINVEDTSVNKWDLFSDCIFLITKQIQSISDFLLCIELSLKYGAYNSNIFTT